MPVRSTLYSHQLYQEADNSSDIYKGHSHKKPKDSLEGSLDRVLLAAILPKDTSTQAISHTPDVNIKLLESQNGQNNCIVYM